MASFGLVFLLLLSCCSTAVLAEIITWDCNHNTPITSTKESSNIDLVLAQLASNTAKSDGFSISSYGVGKDAIHGLAQCRKDVNTSVCSSCIHDAASSIRENCAIDFNSTDQRIFYDKCLLRFSGQNFFGQFDPSTYISLPYLAKESKVTKNPKFFKQQVVTLMNDIISQAIAPGNKGFGKGSIGISSSETVYGIVQCTQDLSTSTCATCLKTGFSKFDKLCKKEKIKGCRLQYGSCYLRYDTDQF